MANEMAIALLLVVSYYSFYMEELTKQQIILVTLLVSFVTSIATGIVTVALMDQAPPGMTQTINRVVERTIEKVTPAQPNQAAAVVTKETVVVKEDDLVVSAIAKNSQSMVSIFGVFGSGDGANSFFIGNGLIVSKDGTIVADISVARSAFDENKNPTSQTFKAILPDGSEMAIVSAPFDSSVDSVAFFKPKSDDKTKLPSFIPATLASADSLKLGQTIIALGGEKISVATGIVSNLEAPASASELQGASSSGSSDTNTASVSLGLKIIKTDISAPAKSLGGILVNLSGEVVGIRLSSAGDADNLFLSANAITQAISKLAGTNIPKQ